MLFHSLRSTSRRALFLRRHALWAVPLSAGLTFYALPKSRPTLDVFSSPTLIPWPPPSASARSLVILSPSEHRLSIVARLQTAFRQNIWEFVLTAKRFIYLFILFGPVLITSPMLLIGKPEKSLRGDRWGAVWWYGVLVSRMEAAGPTFIKVRAPPQFSCQTSIHLLSPAGPMGSFPG